MCWTYCMSNTKAEQVIPLDAYICMADLWFILNTAWCVQWTCTANYIITHLNELLNAMEFKQIWNALILCAYPIGIANIPNSVTLELKKKVQQQKINTRRSCLHYSPSYQGNKLTEWTKTVVCLFCLLLFTLPCFNCLWFRSFSLQIQWLFSLIVTSQLTLTTNVLFAASIIPPKSSPADLTVTVPSRTSAF